MTTDLDLLTVGDELQALADRLAGLPAVDRLSAGAHGTVAAHLPGHRIVGLRLAGDRLEVHVILAAGATVAEAGAQVAAVVAPVVPPSLVDLHIDDVDTGGGQG